MREAEHGQARSLTRQAYTMPFCGIPEAYFRVAITAAGAVVLAVGMDPAAAVGTDAASMLVALWSEWVNPLLPSNPSLTLLERDTPERYWTRVGLIVVGYMMMYLGPAAFFELTNPKPLTEARRKSIEGELRLGVMAMSLNTTFACLWMTFVDPHTPFYGFFHKGDAGANESWWGFEYGHEHTALWFAGGMLAYGIFFDWWFWWTHLVLHWPWCFKHIHSSESHDSLRARCFGFASCVEPRRCGCAFVDERCCMGAECWQDANTRHGEASP